jgi:DNA repair protein RadC
MPVYVSIKNPAGPREAASIASWRGEEAVRPELMRRGYDGIIDKFSGQIVAFRPEQVKSAIGNRGTFSPEEASIIREERGAYAVDLFGDPVDNPPPAPRRGALRPVRRELPVDTEAPAGDYGARTIVNRETKRKLGATSIKSMADAAAATRYLYKSAVERLDGIVTDKNGKPLAVVGGFKGALSEARVFPTTMIAEAVRVPGAAQLWLSHNHPSGTAELSRADEKLAGEIKRVFDGSGIEVKGIVAVAGEKYAEYEPQVGMSFGQRQIPAAAGEVDVPVIERELADRAQPKPAAIQSPAEAKRAAADFYRQGGGRPGIILMDAQHHPAAWIPVPDVAQGKLMGTGGLRALYRAVSEANAGAAIIVHGGELGRPVTGPTSADTNIARALGQAGVNVLDIVNPVTGSSRAEAGTMSQGGAVWSVAALTAAGAAGALAGPDGEESE